MPPPDAVEYLARMQPVIPATEHVDTSTADDDRVRLLHAVAQGLADDAAGRTMDTEALKESLERAVGPISWR